MKHIISRQAASEAECINMAIIIWVTKQYGGLYEGLRRGVVTP